MYRIFFRYVLSKMDPERAHSLAFLVIRLLGVRPVGLMVRQFTRPKPNLAVSTLGLNFATPFGLAAGFDKDAKGILGLGSLGFGHIEVGTLTARAQTGNERPRLFRLIPDRALVNRMGFNNYGSASAVRRLERVRGRSVPRRPVVGVNIGKSRVVEVEDAISDYVESTRLLAPVADYVAVNVSSPNTPGLRGLQELDRLGPLLAAVVSESHNTPVLVKIAPDLTDEQITRVCELAVSLGLAGVIATNTTVSRKGLVTEESAVAAAGAGGLSGAPLAARSFAVLRLIREVVPDDFCVISVGGIDTYQDVAERLKAGATLVQGYTAFLYRGPLWARQINRGLSKTT